MHSCSDCENNYKCASPIGKEKAMSVCSVFVFFRKNES